MSNRRNQLLMALEIASSMNEVCKTTMKRRRFIMIKRTIINLFLGGRGMILQIKKEKIFKKKFFSYKTQNLKKFWLRKEME